MEANELEHGSNKWVAGMIALDKWPEVLDVVNSADIDDLYIASTWKEAQKFRNNPYFLDLYYEEISSLL